MTWSVKTLVHFCTCAQANVTSLFFAKHSQTKRLSNRHYESRAQRTAQMKPNAIAQIAPTKTPDNYTDISAMLGPDRILLEYSLSYVSSSASVSNTGLWCKAGSRTLCSPDPARQLMCGRTSTQNGTQQGSSRASESFRAARRGAGNQCKINIAVL